MSLVIENPWRILGELPNQDPTTPPDRTSSYFTTVRATLFIQSHFQKPPRVYVVPIVILVFFSVPKGPKGGQEDEVGRSRQEKKLGFFW